MRRFGLAALVAALLAGSVWGPGDPDKAAAQSGHRVQNVTAEAGPFHITVEFDERGLAGIDKVVAYHVYAARESWNYSSNWRQRIDHTGKRYADLYTVSGGTKILQPGYRPHRHEVTFSNLPGNVAHKFRVVAIVSGGAESEASAVEVRATTGGQTMWNQWVAEVEKLEQEKCSARTETNCSLVPAIPSGVNGDRSNVLPGRGSSLYKYLPVLWERYAIGRLGVRCMNNATSVPGNDNTIYNMNHTAYTTGTEPREQRRRTWSFSISVNPYDLSADANPKLKTSPHNHYVRGTVSVYPEVPFYGKHGGRQFFNGPCSEAPASNRSGLDTSKSPPWGFHESRDASALQISSNLADASGESAPGHPVYDDYGDGDTTELHLAENSPAGTLVGKPFTATDPDGDTLNWFLDGTDASAFAIDAATGQLSTSGNASFDYETRTSYSFSVIVADADIADDDVNMTSVGVTVRITDVDDDLGIPDTPPTVTESTNSRTLKTHYATVGKALSLVLPAADADSGNGGPYAYEVLNRADNSAFGANGLSFDAATRTLSGTPTAEQTHELTYRVHDADANRAAADAFIDAANLKIVVLPSGGVIGEDNADQSNPAPQVSNNGPEPPVEPDPTPPTATAGADFNIKRGESVTLNGSGAANDGGSQELSYQWTVSGASKQELVTVGAGYLTNATQAQAGFTMMKRKHMTDPSTLDNDNWIEFTLAVTDGDGESHSDTVKVTVSGTTWTPGR